MLMMRKMAAFGMILLIGQAASAQLTNDLELYLKFNETMGRVATDSSGNGRDGFIMNGREAGGLLRDLPGDGGSPVADATTQWYWGAANGELGPFGDGVFMTSGLADMNGNRTSPSNAGGSARAVAISQFGGNLNEMGSNPPAWTMSFWTRGAYFNDGPDEVGYFQGWDNKGSYPGDATTPSEYQSLYGNNNDIETDRARTTAKFAQNSPGPSGDLGWFDNRVNAGTTESILTGTAVGGGPLDDLQDGDWHHVAVIYDNNAWNNNPPVDQTMDNDMFSEVTIYVNGVEAMEDRVDLNGGDRVALGGMVIGGNFGWKGNGGDGQYIDEFALWNRRLSEAEIQFLAAGNMVPEPATGLMITTSLLGFSMFRRRRR